MNKKFEVFVPYRDCGKERVEKEGYGEYLKLAERMEKFLPEIYKELESIFIQLPEETDWKISWNITNKVKHSLGYCKYISRKNKESMIYINGFYYFGYDNDEKLKNTMIHELLHALYPTDGHTGMWKYRAQQLNQKYDYNIKRCATAAETAHVQDKFKPREVKYSFKCKKCGSIHYCYKMSKFVRHYNLYRCGRCGGNFEPLN